MCLSSRPDWPRARRNSSEEKIYECNECFSRNIEKDDKIGKFVCVACGLIFADEEVFFVRSWGMDPGGESSLRALERIRKSNLWNSRDEEILIHQLIQGVSIDRIATSHNRRVREIQRCAFKLYSEGRIRFMYRDDEDDDDGFFPLPLVGSGSKEGNNWSRFSSKGVLSW